MVDGNKMGGLIRHERMRRGLTQADLASMARISKGRVEALEAGRASVVGYGSVTAVLSVLGLELRMHAVSADVGPPRE